MAIDGAHIGLNVDRAEVIELPFLDGEGYDETFFARIVYAGCRNNLHVGIAVFEIKAPDQVAIGLDAVGIVNVSRLQEAQECGLGGLDHLF